MGDSNPDGDDHQSPHPQNDSVQPQMTMHPVTYSSMPMHMYPFPPGAVPSSQPPRTKRRQVKNACTNCQKACKKCDDARPCLRCVKYGIAEECVDSQRKERQKGIKRGPYKKRDGKSKRPPTFYLSSPSSVEQQADVGAQSAMVMPPAVAATSATPPIPYVAPYTPFYGQYPATHVPKSGDGPVYVPQLFYAPIAAPQPMPPNHGVGQDGEPTGYAPPPYYPVFHAPYPAQYAAPYMMQAPPRPEGQMALPAPSHHPHHYAPYPQMYPKPPSRGPELGGQMMDGRRDIRLEGGRMADAMHGGHGKSG
ncbi:uncharacterized protein FIBRA_05018 [Fibroporia radiculosa]|uniref:Transcription activator of gluconeogenesis ERT1 n=1 Tax=Fibroporia radiculosa TaxID=599839 RepID=J4H399_9APHY|nr:uncharacterized protein FIBRA_05018 [Fibroporia radiculosa]CCM02904.1 predicted protein [Fibroporia radiculosa]